jgi:transcriptional regulator with XRE-family HTH domain
MNNTGGIQNMDITSREPIAPLPEPAERARLRKLFAVTQLEVAKHIGVTRQMVNRYERSHSEPSGKARERYAELLATWARSESQIKTEIKKAGDLIHLMHTYLPGI